MKVCLVGGTGNISSAVVNKLLELGHEVTVFNRGSSHQAPHDVRHIQGDRSHRSEFEIAIQKGHFDAGIDMICFNAEDAASSVSAFRGVNHFLMTSTVCTYGIDYDYLPADETHPLRPITSYGKDKAAADAVFLESYYREHFPVTIIKPSTTYGPIQGMVRQVSWDFSWIDRIKKGKPLLVCGDGNAIHQHLHVDDAALAFCGLLGRQRCIGQTYNLVNRGYTTWSTYHQTAMKVLGKEVELVGIPLADLRRLDIPNFSITDEIFAHHVYYSSEKLFRDVPEFQPQISLEQGMRHVFEIMLKENRIPNSDNLEWEDRIISSWRSVFPG